MEANPVARGLFGSRSGKRGVSSLRRIAAATIETLEIRRLLSGSWTHLGTGAPGPLGTMMLLSDGSIIAQTSGNNAGTQWGRLTPDFSGGYINGSWSTINSMQYSRLFDASQVLQNGNVLVAGGEYGTGKNNGELYNPVTGVWITLPPQSYGQISDANSILLPDGKVMIAPVTPTTNGATILFDPTTDSWSQGPLLFRGSTADELSWVKLADDSIIMIDGPTTSERFIPSLNQWVNDAPVPVNLFDNNSEEGPGFLLPSGQVLFIGSTSHTALYTPSGTSAPGTWAAGPDIPAGQGADDAPGAMMPDGNILLALGSSGSFNSPTSFYLYNSETNSFSPLLAPFKDALPPFDARMLALPDGNVMFTDGTTSAWEYNPGDAPLAAGKPTISSVVANGDGTYTLTGTNLTGISAGASYGDDAQMDTNFPLVRLTSVTGIVTYARTFNWSGTGVQTGGAVQTVQFVPSAGITNALQVVTNGIASDPIYPNGHPAAPVVVTPATPSPQFVTGTTANLMALGANPSGPESSLTYTWIGNAQFGGPPPTFSVNGTNAAKNTTATFFQSGNYNIAVMIQDPAGLWTTSSVSITVAPTETGMAVSPSLATISTGLSRQLTAEPLDQFGLPMFRQATYAWSLTSGGGTITSTGLYTAPSTGTLATVSATDGIAVGTASVGVVPQPWVSADVGLVGLPGFAYETGGTFTLSGSGANIAFSADECRYVYQQISGDMSITARVLSVGDTGPFAYAGVMIRNSLAADDVFVAINITPANRTDFSDRTIKGTSGPFTETDGSPAPYWVRLVRTGNSIGAYRSPDGVTWTLMSTVTLPLGSKAYVGLDVCAHNDNAISTSTFDHVAIAPAAVVGRYVFYNNSVYDGNNPAANAADDNAIATDKTALLGGNLAGPANLTSYSKGINGIMIDMQNLPGTPAAVDFSFLVGNVSSTGSWVPAPAPSAVLVRPAAGAHGSTRIEINWPDGAIRNQWLQVTVGADAATGLVAPDVFYFGNLVGSATAAIAGGSFTVSAADMTSARNDPHTFLNPATITDPNDFNRDGRVDAIDQLIARAGTGASLLQLSPALQAALSAPAPTDPRTHTRAILKRRPLAMSLGLLQ